jgi:hypothetical protein
MHAKAEAYERLYPGTGVPEAQAIERQDRIEHRERRQGDGRRSRFTTVPELPWHRKERTS